MLIFDEVVSCAGVTRFPCSSHLPLQPVRKIGVLRLFLKKYSSHPQEMDLPKQSLNFYMLIPGREVSRHLSFQLEFVTEVQMPFFFLFSFPSSMKKLFFESIVNCALQLKKVGYCSSLTDLSQQYLLHTWNGQNRG